MKKIKYWFSALYVIFIMASCTKVIDLKLGDKTGELVIEGNITNVRAPQYITLSRNVPFTNANTYPPVTGAIVSVTDALANFRQFTEGPPGTYSIGRLTGQPGNTYTLQVTTNGKTYSAVSVMPAPVKLDSITSVINDFKRGNNLRDISVNYLDPVGVANQYRFTLSVNGVQVKRVFTYDDEFINGKYVNLELVQNDIDIHPGDTATVEMQCIDKPIYTYWYTLMQQQFNGPGGGITPSNPPTNITPVTLGYFSAHTTQSKSIIVR
ncbi:MAG TPA: DUF4249 domain-containing protein [Mucilaginibacter sp.]|jgi:hypothetical protein